MEAGLIKRIVA